jgi:pimeloyl-ACP methyl ester carboxylesterase
VAATGNGTAYDVEGQGPAVVLVHGLGLTRAMWQWLLPDISHRCRVVTYDLYGHGESADPPAVPDLALLSEQIAALLDHLGIAAAALVGFSLGGMIARRFALDHAPRLSALAILNSAHDRTPLERAAVLKRVAEAAQAGPAATVEAALQRWFNEDCRTAHPELMDLVRGWVMANRADVYARLYRVLATGDAEIATAIAAIDCPTLVMTGEGDVGNSPAMAQRMAAAIPGARTIIVPGLRHMGLVEDPARFNAPLLAFLDKALAGPKPT